MILDIKLKNKTSLQSTNNILPILGIIGVIHLCPTWCTSLPNYII